MQQHTYLTCAELAELLKVSERTIREDWKDAVLVEGRHYIRVWNKRTIRFLLDPILEDLHKGKGSSLMADFRRQAHTEES